MESATPKEFFSFSTDDRQHVEFLYFGTLFASILTNELNRYDAMCTACTLIQTNSKRKKKIE